MNGTNYEVPHCEAFSTRHSHPSRAQIFASGTCYQIPLAWIRGPVWRFWTPLFLQCEVFSLSPNSQAGGPLLVGCPRLLIQYEIIFESKQINKNNTNIKTKYSLVHSISFHSSSVNKQNIFICAILFCHWKSNNPINLLNPTKYQSIESRPKIIHFKNMIYKLKLQNTIFINLLAKR